MTSDQPFSRESSSRPCITPFEGTDTRAERRTDTWREADSPWLEEDESIHYISDTSSVRTEIETNLFYRAVISPYR